MVVVDQHGKNKGLPFFGDQVTAEGHMAGERTGFGINITAVTPVITA